MIPSSAVLGIAVGQEISHAVAVRPASSTLTVSAYHTFECDNKDTLPETIKTLKKTLLSHLPWHQRFSPTVVVGVEDETVIRKTLTAADIDDPLEQEVVVGQALSVALNMDMSGLFFDFMKQRSSCPQSGQVSYEVVACRRQALMPLLAAFKEGGLNVSIVDTQQQGLQEVYHALVQHYQPDSAPLWLHLSAGTLSVICALPDGELYQHRLTVSTMTMDANPEVRERDLGRSRVLQQHLDQAYQRYGTHHPHSVVPLWLSGDWPTHVTSPASTSCTFIHPGEAFGQASLCAQSCAALGLAFRGVRP
ncbi:hypothetical protein [Salinivibrio sp. ES.052]|uniref:hypothetical protein n=1 Tax=Salinivibrio sp. ES.052 TaxID=1882823 RepID=UPI00092ABE01|nr:hypothetical protein [Salinivibrio sp. ES.052]SIO18202.1 Tfp pilus assembly protein, ATPase PilM [Salinivibrio sp. ES.052]